MNKKKFWIIIAVIVFVAAVIVLSVLSQSGKETESKADENMPQASESTQTASAAPTTHSPATPSVKPSSGGPSRLVAEAEKGVPGKEVHVALTLENNPGVISAQYEIAYDESVLTLTSVEDGGILGDTMNCPEISQPYYLNWVNDLAMEDFAESGCIATLTFLVAEDAQAGDTLVKVTAVDDMTINYALETVRLPSTEVTVQIGE